MAPRHVYNSLSDFLTADRKVFDAVFDRPERRRTNLKLPSSVSREEAQRQLEELYKRGRAYAENLLKDARVFEDAQRRNQQSADGKHGQ
jgi:hypothetical protein